MGVALGPRIRTSEVRSATGVVLSGVCGAPWGVWCFLGCVVLPGVCRAPWVMHFSWETDAGGLEI